MNYKGSYRELAEYLSANGFTVYPHEIVCGWIDCPHDQNRAVDVAAYKDGNFYGFEYKSSRDQILRAIKQIENYRLSFDFVILVAEIPRHDISVNPERGSRIQEVLKLGSGLWTVHYQRVPHQMSEIQKASITNTFKQLSFVAPIESHEVPEESNGKLNSDRDMWFWLVYSVMDRRSDASKFVLAKNILEKEQLFSPLSIVQLIQAVGKEKAIRDVGRILRETIEQLSATFLVRRKR